jgi:hypothetical protein
MMEEIEKNIRAKFATIPVEVPAGGFEDDDAE